MALIPRLALLVLAPALAAGCSQSLFASPGDENGNGRPDAGDVDDPDGGGPDRPDGGDSPPDAAMPTDCPAPCLGNAVAEFAEQQGGTSDLWRYVEDSGGTLGTDYVDMDFGVWQNTPAWYGTSNFPFNPTIIHCPSAPDYEACVGMRERLVLGATGAGAGQPALVWRQADPALLAYRLSGEWRVPTEPPMDEVVSLLLVRNSRFDLVREERIPTSALQGEFDFEVEAMPGDELRLIAQSGSATYVPVGTSFYVSGAQQGGACQIMANFDAASPDAKTFANTCAPSSAFVEGGDDPESCAFPNPTCPYTTAIQLPEGLYGQGRKFVDGASLQYTGEPNDYSGDWTVQFWTNLDIPAVVDTDALVSDADCRSETGIEVSRRDLGGGDAELIFAAYVPDPINDRCGVGPISFSTPITDEIWHFVRLSRSTATETMTACIDGQYAGSVGLPAVDISPPRPMSIGRSGGSTAGFEGSIADLRVIKRALPCPEPF